MKKYLFFLSTLISIAGFSQIQPSFGIRAGLSSAGLRGDAVRNFNNLLDFAKGSVVTSNHTGFFAGGYAVIPVSSIFSVEPAIYYTQKGYDLKGSLNIKAIDFLGANVKARLASQYIDLPVLLKANIAGFQIFAGPQVSYLTNADLKTTAGVLGFNLLNAKVDATSMLNKWDMAAVGGVGYQFGNGVNLSASYDYGLAKADAEQRLNTYNHAFKVGVGFTF